MRILVIEDDPRISAFVAKGLRQYAFVVDVADDGEDGLVKAQVTPYDAAVVDLMLPRMDGLTLIEMLRADRNTTPIVVLSAKHSVEDKVRCLRSGADDYLQKPFALTELVARIEAVTRRISRE